MELSLCNEYLLRSGLDKNFIKFPCSFMVASNIPKDVIFITIRQEKHYFNVSHWFLSEPIEELPNNKSYLVSSVLDSPYVILEDFSIFRFVGNPAPAKQQNSYKAPMTGYEEYCNRLFFDNHFKKRQIVLWEYFKRSNVKRIIPINTRSQFGFAYTKVDPDRKLKLEQNYIKKEHPDKWSIWNSWQAEMINLNPGEFYFQSLYACNNNT